MYPFHTSSSFRKFASPSGLSRPENSHLATNIVLPPTRLSISLFHSLTSLHRISLPPLAFGLTLFPLSSAPCSICPELLHWARYVRPLFPATREFARCDTYDKPCPENIDIILILFTEGHSGNGLSDIALSLLLGMSRSNYRCSEDERSGIFRISSRKDAKVLIEICDLDLTRIGCATRRDIRIT